MKRRFFLSSVIFIFALMLIFPKTVFTGASEGIVLWFNIVLPTLLPFMIVSNLLTATSAAAMISRITAPLFCRLFRVSRYGSFAVLTGFLCGYPMGSKVTADLVKQRRITLKEGNYLLSFCNNTSPVFILSYVIWQNLKEESLTLPAVVILTAAPILCSFIFRRFYYHYNYYNKKSFVPSGSYLPAGTHIPASIIDDCIMDGVTAITKVGGYIMLFSIFISLAQMLPFRHPFLTLGVLPSLEITNGIHMISASCPDASLKLLLVLALTSFGGWCSIAQTQCMIQGSGLKIFPYIIEKLVTAVVTSLLTVVFLYF